MSTIHFQNVLGLLEEDGIEIHGRGSLVLRLNAAGESWPAALIEAALHGRREGIYFSCSKIPRSTPQELSDRIAQYGLTLEQRQLLIQNIQLPPSSNPAMRPEQERFHAIRGERLARVGQGLALLAGLATGAVWLVRDSEHFFAVTVIAGAIYATTGVLAFMLWKKWRLLNPKRDEASDD